MKLLLFLLPMIAHAQTPLDRELIAAAERGDASSVQRLIKAGANVNAKNDKQDSAFLIASARGRTDVVKLSLAAGADLKSTNRYGGTGLIPACHYGHLETVKLLLTTNIDVNHVNNLGWTSLLEIVILGDGGPRHQEVARLVLAAGADPNLADKDGVTPLAHARRGGQREVARLIEAAGGRMR
jgi:ankyrin repeat protein